jgi:TRAP-type transport system periplasmic protein
VKLPEKPRHRLLRHLRIAQLAASRGLSRIIEASERGLTGLKKEMDVTALTPEQRQAMKAATQPAFDAHVAENLDGKAGELLILFKDEVAKANASSYAD